MSKRRREKETGVRYLVSALQKKGIQLVAVDFDQTLITFHSGGIWKDDVDKLVSSVRSCIRELIQTCLDRNVHVCIVTYFMQPWVIRELMHKLFKRHDAERVLVQANTPAFREKHNHEFLGKEAHIAAVLTELYNRDHNLKIRPEEVILFDDDKDNTDIAMKFGHKAFLVQEDCNEKALEDFARDVESAETRKSWIK